MMTAALSKRLAPGVQKRGRYIVTPRRRRDLSVTLETLSYDPQLLVQAPSPATPGVDHLQALNLKTILMTSHKVSLTNTRYPSQAAAPGGIPFTRVVVIRLHEFPSQRIVDRRAGLAAPVRRVDRDQPFWQMIIQDTDDDGHDAT
jgi:hypothetical protein